MIESKIIQRVKDILNDNEKLKEKYINDRGGVKRNLISQDVKNYDEKLLKALLDDQLIKETYTLNINGTIIFKNNEFSEMFLYKEYWEDSYTKFSNKIGLTLSGKFIDESTDIVLDFPYKDTVLKADMSKEDIEKDELKPDEPFLNEIIAKSEIDELLESKIFVNAKKYDKDGEHKVTSFSDEDNLIIKGNNLIALHSINKRYAGKIKSIIIDPPYYFDKAKKSDTFGYNSDFKLSSWLVFMKNRLEIAKELLTEDGFCIVMVGKDGYPYLKILSDNIFTRENHVATISWRKSDNQANIGDFAQVTDYIMIYKKKVGVLNRLPLSEKAKKEYRYSDDKGSFRRGILLHKTRGRYHYDVKTPSGKILNGPWMKSKEDFEQLIRDDLVYWTKGGKEQPYSKIYLKNSKGQIANDFWDTTFGTNQRGADEISKLFGKRVFEFPKPELLIKNLISISTNKNDLVLDFFMGSGTTQAVAMKMGRRFIGIEQIDYINTVSIPRLQKVIKGEQGGISNDVNWQGGGSFVYTELMEKNQGYLNDVLGAQDIDELSAVYNRIKENVDFDFRVDLDLFENEKSKLSFEDQRNMLVEIIDKNQLYYNEANIDDQNVHDILSDEDYRFNKSFYEEENDLNV